MLEGWWWLIHLVSRVSTQRDVVVDASTFGAVVVMADTAAVLRFNMTAGGGDGGVVVDVSMCWRDGGDG